MVVCKPNDELVDCLSSTMAVTPIASQDQIVQSVISTFGYWQNVIYGGKHFFSEVFTTIIAHVTVSLQ